MSDEQKNKATSLRPLIRPLSIGRVQLANNLIMAPIAGTTTGPFRGLCHRFGAGLTVSELISAAGIVYDRDFSKNRRYLVRGEAESPAAVQLFGADPKQMAEAIRRLLSHPEYGTYELIDINMGCPVPKVVKTGAGAALMERPDVAEALVRHAVDAAEGVPVTVKIRSGVDERKITAPELAVRLQEAGAAAVALHARTTKQRYAGKADYELMAKVKSEIDIPLIGSGDITDSSDLERMHAIAKVDGFMVGRAAIGRPWLFTELQTNARTPAGIKARALSDLLAGLTDLLGEKTALAEIRTQLAAAVKGYPHASLWRGRFFTASEVGELKQLIDEFFADDTALD